MEISKVGVLGCGTMGRGIVEVLALSGYTVAWVDLKQELLEAAMASITKNLNRQVDKNKISVEDKTLALGRIHYSQNNEILRDAQVVIEAATENMEAKEKIFKGLDEICEPYTILATNTSSLSITQVASATKRPSQVIGMHFFNPVPTMKLIEVIKGLVTSKETTQSIMDLGKSLGKEPVFVEEAPGFVVNRILIPMINEAIGVLADGVSTAEDIDRAMVLGANHPIGPLALGDLIGLDICLAIMEVLYREYGDPKYRPHWLLRKMVRANKLGRKTGEGFFKYS